MTLLLSAIIFVPTLGALILLAFPKKTDEWMRMFTLGVTVATFLLTLLLLGELRRSDPGIQPVYDVRETLAEPARLQEYWVAKKGDVFKNGEIDDSLKVDEHGGVFKDGFLLSDEQANQELQDAQKLSAGQIVANQHAYEKSEIQRGEAHTWIDNWNIYYRIGFDGISLPLVLLTSFISMLAMMASWSITKQVKGYLILFLLLETGMLGVFLALDFFLFYVFWEVMLLPMYFLIGIWGGPRKEYAAIKFFLFTLFGSILILIAMLMFYFGSGNTAAGIEPTFNLMDLAAMGQGQVSGVNFSQGVQLTAFILLFIGFAIKIPIVPFHTWLPDAHVEAPTPISMILAGVLLKMGGYGILRIAFPLCPHGAQVAAHVLVAIGAVSIIYGAFAAMAQTDFKRLVAYSSVSHMGYVVVGMGVWAINKEGGLLGEHYWQMGMNGAMFQMLAHGISSAGMFFMVGVIYDRVHHRDINQFGGLMALMPLYSGLAVGIFFAGLGLPGLCGFIGEVFVVLSAWNYNPLLAIIAAAGVILTAGYILWTIQRVYLGAEYKGPHPELITPINPRETAIASILLIGAIVLGIFPELMFGLMRESVNGLIASLDAGYQAAINHVPDTTTALRN